MRAQWFNAALRSAVWLGASALWAYLKKPEGAGFFAVRSDVIGWSGGAMFLGGWALHVWSNVSLARGEARPWAEPTSLVSLGPYRYVRNPIYLAGLPIFVGIQLLYFRVRGADFVAALVLLVTFHLLVTRIEEPALRRRLGPAYDEYCRRVPRWIPRVL